MTPRNRNKFPLKCISVLTASLMACNMVSAHEGPLSDDQVYSIVIPYSGDSDLNSITRILDHVYIDQNAGTASAEVAAYEIEQLEAEGLQVQINEQETHRISEFVAQQQQLNLGKSMTNGVHSCYRTVGKVYDRFDELAAEYPDFVQVKNLGKSWMGEAFSKALQGGEADTAWAKILQKYLPVNFINTLNLNLFPNEPYPIKVMVVGNFKKQNAQQEAPPNMVWTGGIHAREYAPQEAGLKYLEWLLENYETDANAHMMVDTNRYHFIIHNPDGRSISEQQASASQRKNTNYETAACVPSGRNTAANGGVDLNRNYPFGWRKGGPGGSDVQCSETFRGSEPVSEPETKVVLDYVRGTWNQSACKWEGGALPDGRPKSATYCNPENKDQDGRGEFDWTTGADDHYGGGIFIDLHSYSRAILWSWGVRRPEADNNIQTPNNKGLATIAQRMAYHNKYAAQQVLGYDTEGTTKDTIYGYLGAPSYTLEMGRSFYESCENFDNEVYPENFDGLHYLSRVLYRPYQLPQGPDTVNVVVADAEVVSGEKTVITALVDDNRYLYSKPGQSDIPAPPVPDIKNITSAMAYIDKLPWEPGAKGIPLELSASDQAHENYQDATQVATGTINTTGLALGRHIVYVQGTSEDGQAGSVSAAFLHVKATEDNEVVLIDEQLAQPTPGAVNVGLNVRSSNQCTTNVFSHGSAANVQLPAGTNAVTGLIYFKLSDCDAPGLAAKVTLTLPSKVPQGAKLLKIGKKSVFEISDFTIDGNTISYVVTDGGPLDEDGQVNGEIVDPVMVVTQSVAVPVDQPWTLLLASALIGGLVFRIQRRKSLAKKSASV